MYQHTIAKNIFPFLTISVDAEQSALGLPQIKLTYPAGQIDNGPACLAFERYIATMYDVTNLSDQDGTTTFVLNPLAGTWRPSQTAFLQHFARHMAAYYDLPVEGIYDRCAPSDGYRLGPVHDIHEHLAIHDKPDTSCIEIVIKPCSVQKDFCTWLEHAYQSTRTESTDGIVTLSLKGLRGTYDTLDNPAHLVQLAHAIHNAWGVGYADITRAIQPALAQNYCQSIISHRKDSQAEAACSSDGPYVKNIIVIGTGFSGVSVVHQILSKAIDNPPSRPLHIQLVERNPIFLAAGLAYGAARPEHHVNVEARYLSVDPEEPNDFANWLQTASYNKHGGDEQFLDIPDALSIPSKDPEKAAVQRRLYHYYLADRLSAIIGHAEALGIADTNITFSEAIGADVDLDGVKVHLRNGQTLEGSDLILANGHGPVSVPPFLASVNDHERVVVDQWTQADKIDQLFGNPAVKNVAVLGTGLSSMDIVVTADRKGFFNNPNNRLTLISRGGYTHETHKVGEEYAEPTINLDDYTDSFPSNADEVPGFVAQIFKSIKESGTENVGRPYTDEEVFFALTEQIPNFLLASQIDPKSLLPLLKKYSSLLTTTAVSMAPDIGKIFEHHRGTGQVTVMSSNPVGVENNQDSLIISLDNKGITKSMPVDALLSALPPQSIPQNVPLLEDMLSKGTLRAEPITGIGLDVSDSYQAVGKDGNPLTSVHILGPVIGGEEMTKHGLIGPLFQIISGLRPQAQTIAEQIINACNAFEASGPRQTSVPGNGS